jgi:NAD(P)-dependent dehydrogenase (short-subunit alcohol dehydrogenase family)
MVASFLARVSLFLLDFRGSRSTVSPKGSNQFSIHSGCRVAPHGISVNSIAPTFIETNLTRERLKRPEFKEFVLSKIPSRKLSVPDDVAHAALYLASEEAAMVNATTLSVDGGWTAW